MDDAGGMDHDIRWRSFSLEHVNLEPDKHPDELWGEPERRRGILPAAAAQWAMDRDPGLFGSVQRAIFDANHVDRRKIGRPDVLAEVLDGCGLDGAAVVRELIEDRRWLDAARADHEAADDLNIFGVPTLVYPDRQPLFVRLLEITEGERAVAIYRKVLDAVDDPAIHEIKKTTGARA